MAKVLELNFLAGLQETKITVRSPKEPIDPVAIRAAMEQMIASDVFLTYKGRLTGIVDARLVERNVQDIIL